MPEGDTVALAASRLHAALAGRSIGVSDLRVPAFATSDLSGREILEVASRGKHLLFRLGGGITLHSHFGMDGSWHLYRDGERWRGGPGHEIRAVVAAAPWTAVGYRLKVVEVLPTAEEGMALGHLGPDVLGPDWDAGEALRRLSAQPARPIADAVMDQRIMAGPGNVYRSEVCFLRGLHPATPVGAVPSLPRLVDLVKRLMEANRTTGNQVTTGDPRPGRRNWVYGRAGRPCRRCGTPVARAGPPAATAPPTPLEAVDVSRPLFWCPSCQPAAEGGV